MGWKGLPYRVLLAVLLGAAPVSPVAAASPGEDARASLPAARREIDRLLSNDRLEEALPLEEGLAAAARAAGDEEAWTRALVEAAGLRAELGDPADAIRFLEAQPRPEGALSRAVIGLESAEMRVRYLRAHGWEIDRRETTEAEGEVPLERQTREQIVDAALAAGREAWSLRDTIGDAPAAGLRAYLEPNPSPYPEGVRGTARDVLTYLYVDLLGKPGLRPPVSGEGSDLPALILGAAPPLGAPAASPLEETAAVLGGLERWHLKAGRREAALEARRVRLLTLHGLFTGLEQRRLIRQALGESLDGVRDVPWWSMGMATLAEMLKEDREPGSLVRAHDAAVAGRDAWPSSPGGERCRALAEEIERPAFDLRGMESDGLGRRSLEVSHKNLAALYFRAYLADPQAAEPSGEAVKALLRDGRPVAQWRSELPATPDFGRHVTWVVPPIDHPGAYLVVASLREGFASLEEIVALRIVLTDLVLVHRTVGSEVEVLALSGATGEPRPGVAVTLRAGGPGEGCVRAAGAGSTGADGLLRLPLAEGGTYCLSASSAAGPAPGAAFYAYRPAASDPRPSALLYTDRAIYRPRQTIFWKVLVYGGEAAEGRLVAQAGRTVKVSLRDANDQEVASREVATNGFGTASGEFPIPAGRLLGEWTLESSLVEGAPTPGWMGRAQVRVEEYKRPTFEVVLDGPAAPPRLGVPARIAGRAVYYFGLPVTRGRVRWRVVREAVDPRWPGERPVPERTVAMGTAEPGADGTFEVAFTPEGEADDLLDPRACRYDVRAEVTDGGGETRQAERSFRVGAAAVEGEIAKGRGFLRAGSPAVVAVTRRDLNGVPRPGAASWALYELRPPARPRLPADEPRYPEAAGFRTPGDRINPRWSAFPSAALVLRSWPTGRRLAGGPLRHGADGGAEVRLPALRPGTYRLVWESRDGEGGRAEASRDLLVTGPRTPLALPAVLRAESATVRVGGIARLLAHTGFPGQVFYFEVWRGGERIDRRTLRGGESPAVIEWRIAPADRGGLTFELLLLRDHQLCDLTATVQVPWDDRRLRVDLATFRDRLRPGAKEVWRITVHPAAGRASEAVAAEVLAAMSDRSLEVFERHAWPDPLGLYPDHARAPAPAAGLGPRSGTGWPPLPPPPAVPPPRGDRLFSGLQGDRLRVGPIVFRGGRMEQTIQVTTRSPLLDERRIATGAMTASAREDSSPPDRPLPAMPPRAGFAETAFWRPHLLTGPDGTATIEFTVPDAVTSWDVLVQAVTRDLRAGTVRREARSARDLLVRPYLPRFLREGDRVRLKVVVTNARKTPLRGEVRLDVTDPESGESLLAAFGVAAKGARLPFAAPAVGGTSVVFPLTAPARVGLAAFKVTAVAGSEEDGELHPLPVLPSRVHLAQSRFAVLRGPGRRELRFPELEARNPARTDERLVVSVQGQLFQGVLAALPYLVDDPYECVEQTLNRFVSTGTVASLLDRYPTVARLAAELAQRETPPAAWDAPDPNRGLPLEETPFLEEAQGGDRRRSLLKVLDPRIARAQRDASLERLARSQLASGAFPWWPGGPPSPYMTAYTLLGLARAAEFGAEVPREVVRKGWSYLASEYRQGAAVCQDDGCLAVATLANYAATAYPDPSWVGDALPEAERRRLLDAGFARWRNLSPYVRSLLALTLKRMGRPDDARLVFDSVMDRARTDPEAGTFWAPRERRWLWYEDPVESHAFALRALLELRPDDPRRHGLVQWLFLSQRLNHWKSTRATAEVLDAVVRYLAAEGELGAAQSATVRVGGEAATLSFDPGRYEGKQEVVIPGERIDPTRSTVAVETAAPGFLLAAATWHFSTAEPPAAGAGDLFHVFRRYFLRQPTATGWTLVPLAPETALRLGDEVEEELTVSVRADAEYVQLRDPRPAGLEPEDPLSGWRWERGRGWYQETRDSATSFFFERLPAGRLTLRYRLRAGLAGALRTGPATVQSMYAPEFTAYSAAAALRVEE